MNFSDILLMALRNLRQAKLRATLTITGVVVGVTSIVCMVSFAIGLQENLLNQTLAKFDIFTTIPVSGASISMLLEMGQNNDIAAEEAPKSAPKETAGQPPGALARMRQQPRRMLDDKAIAEIEKIPGVEYVMPRIGFSAIVQFDGKTRQLNLSGGPSDLARLPGSKTLLAGQGFSNDYAKELLVGENFIRSFSRPGTAGTSATAIMAAKAKTPPTEAERKEKAQQLVGKTIELLTLRGNDAPAPEGSTGVETRYERHVFRIVGVLAEEKGRGLFEQVFIGNNSLLVPTGQARLLRKLNNDPLSRIGETLLGDTGYQAAIVRVKSPAETQVVFELINKMGLRAVSLTQQLSEVKRVFMIIDGSLALLGGISLFVAALGISNTLIMSITERTREIGVMKAIGGDDRTIMSIFFCEAGLLGLIGGSLGVMLGWALDTAASMIVNHFIAGAVSGSKAVQFFSIPWYLWIGAIVFAVGVSLLAAAYPALRAARVDPIKALRHD